MSQQVFSALAVFLWILGVCPEASLQWWLVGWVEVCSPSKWVVVVVQEVTTRLPAK